ncbi:MAG: NBR1-Ig-like domain-containing protein [Anaerolineales bacterium]
MKYLLIFSFIVILALLPACGRNASPPTPNIELIVLQTQTAEAIEHLLSTTTADQGLHTTITLQPELPTEQIQAPTPSLTPKPDCSEKVELESEMIPDQANFLPGVNFEKTWILRNVGTCTWTPDYSIIFVGGEQMNGESPTAIGQTVSPDGEIEITLPLEAPPYDGYYESFWKLQNERGEQFGLGAESNVALWIKIDVGDKSDIGDQQDFGNPDWIDTFDGKKQYWYMGGDTYTNFEIVDGKLVMTAIQPTGDLWRIAKYPELGNIYLEMIATTGNSCSGKDGYGVIVRAPDQPDGIIDSGYIFGISCDGMYRVFRMDEGEFNAIQSWTSNEKINAGPNKINRFGVKILGSKFQLFVNGSIISEFYDETYPSGLFGLMIRSDGTSGFQVFVDEIAYWRVVE